MLPQQPTPHTQLRQRAIIKQRNHIAISKTATVQNTDNQNPRTTAADCEAPRIAIEIPHFYDHHSSLPVHRHLRGKRAPTSLRNAKMHHASPKYHPTEDQTRKHRLQTLWHMPSPIQNQRQISAAPQKTRSRDVCDRESFTPQEAAPMKHHNNNQPNRSK